MKGKITVMTIITGVRSPWILGKETAKEKAAEKDRLGSELGIDIV